VKDYLLGKVWHEKAFLILVRYHEILDVLRGNQLIPRVADDERIHVEGFHYHDPRGILYDDIVHHVEQYQSDQVFVHPLQVEDPEDVFESNEEKISWVLIHKPMSMATLTTCTGYPGFLGLRSSSSRYRTVACMSFMSPVIWLRSSFGTIGAPISCNFLHRVDNLSRTQSISGRIEVEAASPFFFHFLSFLSVLLCIATSLATAWSVLGVILVVGGAVKAVASSSGVS
jgi:hypothetical protein